MAMGQVKGQAATLQAEMVCLDELVPEDDRYRRLDRLVDWGFVRELAASYYAEDVGRPSIDPIVLVKLMVAGALEGIGSTRELLRQAGMGLHPRRLLGYGLAGASGCPPPRRSRTPTAVASWTRHCSSASFCARSSCASSTGWSRARICRSTASTLRRTRRLRGCVRASRLRPRRRPRRRMPPSRASVARRSLSAGLPSTRGRRVVSRAGSVLR